MNKRWDNRHAADRYAFFIKPLIEHIGGVREANVEYFRWKGRGEDTPDYRDFFSAQTGATRRVGPVGVFETGRFLQEAIPWCNPLVTLYAAGHLDAYVAVVAAMVRAATFVNEIRLIACSVGQATHTFDLDAFITLPNPLAVRENGRSLGACFCDVVDNDEFGFPEKWTNAPEAVHGLKDIQDDFRIRHEARKLCIVRDPAFLGTMMPMFAQWHQHKPKDLSLPIDLGDIAIAYGVSRTTGIHLDIKRYAIDMHLRNHFSGTGWVSVLPN